MKKSRIISFALIACALSVASLPGISNLAAAGPVEGALNLERVGIGTTSDGQVDLGPYSKLAPGPIPTATTCTPDVTTRLRSLRRLEHPNAS